MKASRSGAEELSFWLYVAILAVNGAYIIVSLRVTQELSPIQSLVIAGRNYVVFLVTLAIAAATALMEVLPFPLQERRVRVLRASRNLLATSALLLLLWALAFAAATRSLGGFLGWLLDARYAVVTPLFISLMAALMALPSPRGLLRGEHTPLLLLLLLPLAPYLLARLTSLSLGPSTALAAILLLISLLYVGFYLYRRA